MAAAIATSLCCVGFAPVAAQGPPHNPASNVTKTKWANFPAETNTGKLLPAANQPPFTAPPLIVTPQPTTRVVVFQKVADEDTAKKREVDEKMKADLKLPVSPINRPDPAKVFRIESDSGLDQRMKNELYEAALEKYNAEKKLFDEKRDPTKTPPSKRIREEFKLPDPGFNINNSANYVSRIGTYPPTQAKLEPGFLVHRRLMFEEVNAERYGWDFGLLSPVVSSAYFYKDLLLWPAHLASNWRERYATNAGKYLPGTPVPYFLYPPEITITGGAIGAGAIVATSLLLLP